jgi:hypothetical protein
VLSSKTERDAAERGERDAREPGGGEEAVEAARHVLTPILRTILNVEAEDTETAPVAC